MKKLTLLFVLAIVVIASSCSKEKKITKILWKPEGTWNVTSSSYGYYSMGTYNTTTGSYEDSLTLASGDYNGSTFFFDKFDNSSYLGDGTFTTTDTTINFTYFVSEDIDYNTGKPNGNFSLILENEAAPGTTSEQDIYKILSYDDTKMSIQDNNSGGWSTNPYQVTHSYISIEMEK